MEKIKEKNQKVPKKIKIIMILKARNSIQMNFMNFFCRTHQKDAKPRKNETHQTLVQNYTIIPILVIWDFMDHSKTGEDMKKYVKLSLAWKLERK